MFINLTKKCIKHAPKTNFYPVISENHTKTSNIISLINKCYLSGYAYKRPRGNNNYRPSRTNNKSDNINFVNDNTGDKILSNALDFVKIENVGDWDRIRKCILEDQQNFRGIFTLKNIDAVIMGYCKKNKEYNLARTYLNYLESKNVKPNLATTGKYLKFFYERYVEKNCWKCDSSDEQEIFKIYDDLRKEYPVLDASTLESVLLVLSLTSKWENCLELLQEIKVSASPSATVYSAVATACFLNEKEDTGWNLLKELLELSKQPRNNAYLSYLDTIKKLRNKQDIIAKLEKLFLFLQEYELKCDQPVVMDLNQFAAKLGFKSQLANVLQKGICKNCSQQLQKFELTENEFDELKSKFFQNVILGKDLFTKTNPQELENFKNFIHTMGKFDVVLDGLNVAYSAGVKTSPQVYVSLLAAVVRHFVEQNKSVLVLGRVHMNRWPRNEWNFIKQNATVFLTQNISEDDPYLLYCALNSGQDTIVVTKDLMRGHKFLLKQPKYKTWFNRWLTQRQYQLIRVDDKGRAVFSLPPPFSVIAQKNDDIWHIPYSKGEESEDFHRNWFCIELK